MVPKEIHVRSPRTVEDLLAGERGWVDVIGVVRGPDEICLLRRRAIISEQPSGPRSRMALVERSDEGFTVTLPRTAKIGPARSGLTTMFGHHDRYFEVGCLMRFRFLHIGREPL